LFVSWYIFESTAITLPGVRVEGKLFFFCLWLNLKRSAFFYFGEHGKFWELGVILPKNCELLFLKKELLSFFTAAGLKIRKRMTTG
jgi:hypothetical protein